MASLVVGGEATAWTLESAARSHIGLVRTVNEDRFLNRADRGLFAVADGMGGHSRGDVAADAVITALAQLANGAAAITPDRLNAAMHDANRRVHAPYASRASQSGSTVAGLLVAKGGVVVFWAGDSRVYRLRAGELRLMTRDHRVVQDMIDAGVLDESAARTHPRASVITRAVGGDAVLALAVVEEALAPGDTYLLCSDGLSDPVDAASLAFMLARSPAQAADALLDAAIAAGGLTMFR